MLKTAWETFSGEQQAVMRMTYGLPLSSQDLAIWHAMHGGGVFDELGYLLSVHDSGVPYVVGREYNDFTWIVGRRAAKSCCLSFICTFEALCGGHKSRLINDDQQPVFLLVAQDLKRAMKNKNEYVLHYLKSSPVGRVELQGANEAKRPVTQRSIWLPNCGIVEVGPPTIKLRGDSVAFCGMDEVAFWPSDDKSAAPDFEVERAVRSGMSQFYPFAKIGKVSTPWTEQGLLWESYQLGTHGRHSTDPRRRAASERVLVLKGPSPVMHNPSISREWLMEERAKDGDAFRREILADFAKSVSGFLPVPLLRRAVDSQVSRRPAVPGVWYTAAIDPAFRRDAFAMSIGHLEEGGVFVQDFCASWRGTSEAPLNPGILLPVVGALAAEYGLNTVLSDQYHQESLQHIAQEAGFLIEPFRLDYKTKTAMWRDFVTLLKQETPDGRPKVRLLDHEEQLAEFSALEKQLTPNGQEKIAGRRDDLAVVTAMCLHRALSFGVASPKSGTRAEPTSTDWAKFAADRSEAGMRPKVRVKAWWSR